jgi:hypothetical protein
MTDHALFDRRGKARVSVRPHTYRGKPGWSIYGRDCLGRSVKIHTVTETSRDRIVANIKACKDDFATLEDFNA